MGVQRSPTANTFIYNNLVSMVALVTFSNVITDFHPSLLSVDGSLEPQPSNLTVAEVNRVFYVYLVPTLSSTSTTTIVYLASNKVNHGSSIVSSPVVFTYGTAFTTIT